MHAFVLTTSELVVLCPQPSAHTRRSRMPPFRPPPRRVVPYNEEVDSQVRPPLALLLEQDPRVVNVLGQAFIRRLTIEQSCSTIGQLLALNRPQIDALLDALRPLPGHRDIFIDFLNSQRVAAEEQRRKRQEEAAISATMSTDDGSGGDGGGGAEGEASGDKDPTAAATASAAATAVRPGTAPPTLGEATVTPAQRRAWRKSFHLLRNSSIAAKRGGDGHLSHLISQQPLQWGFVKGPAPQASAYISHVKVLTFGRNRILDYSGPAPNSPKTKPGGRGGGYGKERRAYDPDVF